MTKLSSRRSAKEIGTSMEWNILNPIPDETFQETPPVIHQKLCLDLYIADMDICTLHKYSKIIN